VVGREFVIAGAADMALIAAGSTRSRVTDSGRRVGIVRCTVLLLGLLLAIRPQGEHSCALTIPDRFIGVDDMDSPGQRW
jgi:hypothetical protein